jgi:hypothetical protein
MALMLSIMAGMLHDMLYSLGRRASLGQEFISFYQPTRSAGRHGNLRRLKTWTLETFMVNVSSTPASFERGYAPAALRQRASTFWSRGAS